MKCLSLWQPWASVLFEKDSEGSPVKPDETRPWRTDIRGIIAIHAARHVVPYETQAFYAPMLRPLGLSFATIPYGMIIGTVEIVDCRPAEVVALERRAWHIFWGDYRTVGDDGKKRYALEFRNPLKLTNPIPCTGRQKFFEVNL